MAEKRKPQSVPFKMGLRPPSIPEGVDPSLPIPAGEDEIDPVEAFLDGLMGSQAPGSGAGAGGALLGAGLLPTGKIKELIKLMKSMGLSIPPNLLASSKQLSRLKKPAGGTRIPEMDPTRHPVDEFMNELRTRPENQGQGGTSEVKAIWPFNRKKKPVEPIPVEAPPVEPATAPSEPTLPWEAESTPATPEPPPNPRSLGALSKLPKGVRLREVEKFDHTPTGSFIDGNSYRTNQNALKAEGTKFYDPDPFVREYNTLNESDTESMKALEKSFLKDSPKATPKFNYPMMPSTQRRLPSAGGDPLVSVSEDVRSGEGNEIYQKLRKLHKDYQGPENLPPDLVDFVSSLNIDDRAGGAFSLRDKSMNIGSQTMDSAETPVNTLAHELRHAMDKVNRPEVFDNYPNTFLSGLIGPPAGYFSHPSEVRARATGQLEDFLHTSPSKQGTLDKDFLEQLAQGIEGLEGARLEDLKALAKRGSPPEFPPYVSEPYQRELDVRLPTRPVKKKNPNSGR